jgi:hypothetical protein
VADDDTPARLRIDPAEVAAAVVPPPRPPRITEAPAQRRPRISQAAVASLVLAILGLPLLGCLLGPVAIACGVLAIARI